MRNACSFVRPLLLVLILFPVIAANARGKPQELRSSVPSTRELAKRVLPSVVALTVRDANGTIAASGTGFVVGPNLIATSYHVVSGAASVTVNFANGRSETAPGVVALDKSLDVAILFADTRRSKPLPFGDSSNIAAGDGVVLVSNPIGLKGTVSTGIVSAVRSFQSVKLIQTSAPLSPGSSGGPLLNSSGQVVGIAALYLSEGQNLNFAVPSFYVKQLIPSSPKAYHSWSALISPDQAEGTLSRNVFTSTGENTDIEAAPVARESPSYYNLATLRRVRLEVEGMSETAKDIDLTSSDMESAVRTSLKGSGLAISTDQDDPEIYISEYMYEQIPAGEDTPAYYVARVRIQVQDLFVVPAPNDPSKKVYAYAVFHDADNLIWGSKTRMKTSLLDTLSGLIDGLLKEIKSEKAKAKTEASEASG